MVKAGEPGGGAGHGARRTVSGGRGAVPNHGRDGARGRGATPGAGGAAGPPRGRGPRAAVGEREATASAGLAPPGAHCGAAGQGAAGHAAGESRPVRSSYVPCDEPAWPGEPPHRRRARGGTAGWRAWSRHWRARRGSGPVRWSAGGHPAPAASRGSPPTSRAAAGRAAHPRGLRLWRRRRRSILCCCPQVHYRHASAAGPSYRPTAPSHEPRSGLITRIVLD
jgi:hypothetical protein